MAFTSLHYDDKYYKHQLSESTGTGKYNLKEYAGVHDERCFETYPEITGTNQKRIGSKYPIHYENDMVNIESDLFNLPRKASKNPKLQYPTIKFEYKKKPTLKECQHMLENRHTRMEAPIFRRGQSINRFESLCIDPQSLNRIRSNAYIGTNTRLWNRDHYVPKIPEPVSQVTVLPKPKPIQPKMNCACTVENKMSESFKNTANSSCKN